MRVRKLGIIPLREKIGNYDVFKVLVMLGVHYTTTRENWELRPLSLIGFVLRYYTTTRENWELRLSSLTILMSIHYTTTRENWELRRRIARCPWQYDYTTTRDNWELRRAPLTTAQL